MKGNVLKKLINKILTAVPVDSGDDDGDGLERSLPRVRTYDNRIKALEEAERKAEALISHYEEQLRVVARKSQELQEAIEKTMEFYNSRDKEKAAAEKKKLQLIQEQAAELEKTAEKERELFQANLEDLVCLEDPELDEV